MAKHSLKPAVEIGIARKTEKVVVKVIFGDDKKLWVEWPGDTGLTRFDAKVEYDEGTGLANARAKSISNNQENMVSSEILKACLVPKSEEELFALPLAETVGIEGFLRVMNGLWRTGQIKPAEGNKIVKA